MNPCHGLSVISLDWITVYCSLTCRRNVDSCKICCDDDGEDKVGCDGFAQYFHANCLRVDYHPFFLSPLIANGTNYFCLTNHKQWEADHWLLRENQRHFMELNSVREFFRAKSVSSIEADDHFKEAADAKTKHHIWNTRQNTICSETLERKRTTNKRRRIEEKKQRNYHESWNP